MELQYRLRFCYSVIPVPTPTLRTSRWLRGPPPNMATNIALPRLNVSLSQSQVVPVFRRPPLDDSFCWPPPPAEALRTPPGHDLGQPNVAAPATFPCRRQRLSHVCLRLSAVQLIALVRFLPSTTSNGQSVASDRVFSSLHGHPPASDHLHVVSVLPPPICAIHFSLCRVFRLLIP